MIRRITCLVMVGILALAAWGGSTASAQERQGGQRGRGGRGPGFGMLGMMGGGGGGLLPLLQSETVQKDLELTTEQVDKVKDLAKSAMKDLMPKLEGLRDLSQEDRRAKLKDLRPKLEAQGQETKKKIEAILTPKQMERLKGIRLQVLGAGAFNDPEVVKALNLTDEQTDKIKKIVKETIDKVAELTKGVGTMSRQERRKRCRA